MSECVGYSAITVSEFADGTAYLRWNRMDMTTRKLTYEDLTAVKQPARDPFTAEELALMGALEQFCRRMGDDAEIRW